MSGLNSLFKSRKFWLTLLAFIAASVAFAQHTVSGDVWVESIVALIAVLVFSIAHEDANQTKDSDSPKS